MLTDTMTSREILAEMTADRDLLLRRLSHELRRWHRASIKQKGNILYDKGEWTSPKTRNRWLWSSRIADRRMRTVGLCYGILRYRDEGMEFLLFLPSDADYGASETSYLRLQDSLHGQHHVCRFTPHCWQRVRERIRGMHRFYGRELVEHVLFSADNEYFAITENREAQSATGLQLERPLQMVVADGAFLGHKSSPGFVQFNTFIGHHQTQGRQREIIGGLKEKILSANSK